MPPSLERLIFGRPLSDRSTTNADTAADAAALDELLQQIINHFNSEYEIDCIGRQHAVHEIRSIKTLEASPSALIAKRTMLCFFFAREYKAALQIFGAKEADRLVVDRVGASILPLLLPVFLSHLAQTPDKLLSATSVLWGLWGGEDVAVRQDW